MVGRRGEGMVRVDSWGGVAVGKNKEVVIRGEKMNGGE